MYASPDETLAALERVGYFTDQKTATTVYLAGKLHRPITLEGPAGAGKTELATPVSRAYGIPVFRICSRVSAGKVSPRRAMVVSRLSFTLPPLFICVCVWGWADPAPRGSSPVCTRPSICSSEGPQSRSLDCPSLGPGPRWRRIPCCP
jgi:hypothetical protein